ncbi:MAG: type II toxin-antitoxin system RelE/ParE family toxin [Planctomycetes bacterium]|nr:type II toxin-antitoxin system RelE/ParE family toxin [Planctomycetota bacterium]
MRQVNIQAAALADLAQADAWYEAQFPGLGDELLDEFRLAVAKIAEYPLSFTEIDEGVRRAMLRRFPYHVIYIVEDSSIEVVAALHAHRHSNAWRLRLDR